MTVASSPCFSTREAWPGIKPEVLAGFQHQLSEDFQRTVERFLALQTMGNRNRPSGCADAEADGAFSADAGG